MRDPKRITPMLELIDAIWKKSPDLRLCQILSNGAKYADWSHGDLFHLEDEDLAEGLMLLEAELHLLTQYTVTINDDAEWNKPWSSFEDHLVTDITSQGCKDQRAEFWEGGKATGKSHPSQSLIVHDDKPGTTASLGELMKRRWASITGDTCCECMAACNMWAVDMVCDGFLAAPVGSKEEPVESKGLPWGVVTQ